jgi:hypothetical protein
MLFEAACRIHSRRYVMFIARRIEADPDGPAAVLHGVGVCAQAPAAATLPSIPGLKKTKLRSLLAGGWLAASALASTAQAADFTFELAGQTANANFWQQGGYSLGQLLLTDAASGDATLPGFVVSLGDTVSATVTLDHPFAIPSAGQAWSTVWLYLQDYQQPSPTSVLTVIYSEQISFFAGGVQVQPDASFQAFGGCGGGGLCLGSGSVSGFAGFSFDKLVVSASVNQILDSDHNSYASATLLPTTAALSYSIAAVPEPATTTLAAFGLAMLGWLVRRSPARTVA